MKQFFGLNSLLSFNDYVLVIEVHSFFISIQFRLHHYFIILKMLTFPSGLVASGTPLWFVVTFSPLLMLICLFLWTGVDLIRLTPLTNCLYCTIFLWFWFRASAFLLPIAVVIKPDLFSFASLHPFEVVILIRFIWLPPFIICDCCPLLQFDCNWNVWLLEKGSSLVAMITFFELIPPRLIWVNFVGWWCCWLPFKEEKWLKSSLFWLLQLLFESFSLDILDVSPSLLKFKFSCFMFFSFSIEFIVLLMLVVIDDESVVSDGSSLLLRWEYLPFKLKKKCLDFYRKYVPLTLQIFIIIFILITFVCYDLKIRNIV